MIYFDNSATTPIFPQSLDAYIKTSQRIIGNPSSLHDLGNQANRLLQQARKQIAELITVTPDEIYFTSGGTEGDNWVLKGTMIEKREYGNHMIISGIEHPAVSETAEQLKSLGVEVSIAPVYNQGFVIVDELKKLIRKDTVLVSIMAVNNEIGSIQPILEISELLKEYPKIHFHVDAVQAIGKVSLSEWLTERVDFATFSAHKFHGPRGIGFIYWKKGRRLAPLLNGGGQEKNQRSGTENVPAIVAMAKALRIALDRKLQKPDHTKHLKEALINALKAYEKVTIFSEGEDYAPHILCFSLKGIRGEVLVHALEEKQIFISTTSACSSRKHLASSTLHAMHVPDDLATSAVRISLDESNSMAEVEQFMIIFKQLYKKFSTIN
ncbi:cysteine desulfurase family protein [Enterococcus hirae]|uniref:Aminotransferase class V domain-containing protein n=1 Tax=Enterococcus hirae TaxID=1354 RepID=A0AB37INH0_ENTHR|nr:cysteine desulfurase family protein [Enterococcus hirae]EMF0484978.1 cysteine desulfurase [Enterococcus hirae]PCE05800.1 aminotransferase [Enterococcus hirae]RBT45678.1 class V aminotransferase [Enterococcus hirae]RBT50284.1 class V aminotransferase [Enterococcus hirae]RBT50772.1 class V aminotransferase [Enterococcus hirae]